VTKKKKNAKSRRGISWPVIVAMLLLIVAVLSWRGYDYYLLSLDDRVEHPDYRTLRSSGHIGYGYGVAGTFLIFTNLLYLARRRLARWNMGSVKTWLDVHVFTGLSGALFISFHATFKVRSTMAQVTTFSLLLVVITGLIGRFLYALIPRDAAGDFKDAMGELESIAPQASMAISEGLRAHKIESPGRVPVWKIPRVLGELRRVLQHQIELIRLTIENNELYQHDPKSLGELSSRLQDCARKKVRTISAGAVLRAWRGLHLFFAILMLLTVVFHIGAAWYYGYRWFWSA
jgi:hypothetical protein